MSGWKLCPQNSFRLSHPALKVSLNYVLSSFTVFTQNFNMITQTDISPSDRWIITQQIIKWFYSKWDTINVSHTLTAFFFTDRCRDFFYLFRCYSHRCHGTDCLCTCLATRGSWSISDVTWCLALLLWESNHQLQHFLRCVCVSELRTQRILWTPETCLMSLPEKLLCGEQTRRAAAVDYFRWRVYMGLLGQAVRVCKSVSCVWQHSGADIVGQSLTARWIIPANFSLLCLSLARTARSQRVLRDEKRRA